MPPTSKPPSDRVEGPEVWLGADTLTWPEGGGHFWPYLNWALGFRANGCRVVWLERVDPDLSPDRVAVLRRALEEKLERYGFGGRLALYRGEAEQIESTIDLDRAGEADLLFNISYDANKGVLDRFSRTALLDIDPGLAQIWAAEGTCPLPSHDLYFTIGETVGKQDAPFPDCGLDWQYTPPCVALDWWPVVPSPADAPFTTVSNWINVEWFVDAQGVHNNNKRTAFRPYLDLPARVEAPLELAICLEADEQLRPLPDAHREQQELEQLGWRVMHSYAVATTPWDYQRYIQASRGEFSCAKASCRLLQNAWISDRTLCYLASGRPAVVEHTGPSSLLPDRAGVLRFRTPEEAVDCVREATLDHSRHARLAQELAAEHFDARAVAGRVLDRALGGIRSKQPPVSAN